MVSESICNLFIEYCNKTNMSYSYKPVLIMALVENGGKISIPEAAEYFFKFYNNRLSLGLIAERPNSIYSKLESSFSQIESNIKSNPVKALINSDFFSYDSKLQLLTIKDKYWNYMTEIWKKKIIYACTKRLDDYYARIQNEGALDVVCFHKPSEENGYLSNWYQSTFFAHGLDFTSVEQYMMYRKALEFQDFPSRDRILNTSDVELIKHIGRNVKNYNERIWNGKRQLIVYQGLLSKFSQNDLLRQRLLRTGSDLLAECSVSDKIWGIGLSLNDDRRFLVDEWCGNNLLGFSLMQVRNALRESTNP